MSIIPIEVAMQHVYADPADQPQVERKLASAIETAEQFMNRRLYATAGELETAKIQAAADIRALAEVSSTTLPSQANEVLLKLQTNINQTKFFQAKMAILGIVVNPAIEIGILLILGELYKNRENTVESTVTELPMGAKHHLQPFRIDMGV